MDPVIEVAAGLVFRHGRLLITQRRPGDHLGGLWEFPGGKRHPGESFEACLKRELLEELEIEVDVGPEIESIHHRYPEKTVWLRFYRCAWRQHEPRPVGCHALAWITARELRGFPFPPADAQLLHRLETDARLWQPTEPSASRPSELRESQTSLPRPPAAPQPGG